MPVDYSQIKPPRPLNPLELSGDRAAHTGQLMQLKNLMAQSAFAEQERKDHMLLRDIMKNTGGDLGEMEKQAYGAGLYKQGMEIGKSRREQEKSGLEMDKTRAEMVSKNIATMRDVIAQARSDADMPYVREMAFKLWGEKGAARVPERFDLEWQASSVLDADAQVERLFPKQQLVEVADPANPTRTIKKWMAPGQTDGVVAGQGKLPEILDPQVQAARRDIARAGASSTNVSVSTGGKPFLEELGKAEAKDFVESRKGATDAAEMIKTTSEGRRLLDSGIISGAGAEYLLNAGRVLKRMGINFAEDEIANTQAYTANMAQNVGKVIKQFGAGTGLSDADREYAEKMAGGKITIDEKAMRRILDINERAARNILTTYNKKAKSLQKDPNTAFLPYSMEVEEPPADTPQRRATDKQPVMKFDAQGNPVQ